MPIYEYECNICEHHFEKIQNFSDPPLKVCPECNGSVRKLLSLSSFHLKGSGWYKDSYTKPNSEKSKKKDKSSAKKKQSDNQSV